MKNTILALRGHLGVGKTTLAQQLSENYGFVLLSKDDIYLAAIDELPEDPHAASRIAYASMFNILSANRSSGLNFALDAPYRDNSDILRLSQTTREWGYSFGSILITCNDRTAWDERLRQRLQTSRPHHQITSLVALESSPGGLIKVEPIVGELVINTANEHSELGSSLLQCYRYAERLPFSQ